MVYSSLRDDFDKAYRYLMLLRLKNQLKQVEQNLEVNNKVEIKSISDIDRIMIKKIVSTISDHQSRIGIDFRVG